MAGRKIEEFTQSEKVKCIKTKEERANDMKAKKSKTIRNLGWQKKKKAG
jgi:hypothetical protein